MQHEPDRRHGGRVGEEPRRNHEPADGSLQTAQSEEQVDQIQSSSAMRPAYAAGQRIRACHHDAAAHAQQEQKEHKLPHLLHLLDHLYQLQLTELL